MQSVPASGMPDPVDVSNGLLAPSPAHLLTAVKDDEGLGLITIRTPTTTLTVHLPKADVLAWGHIIIELGDSMTEGSALLVATPNTMLIRP
jgi:hypothetical protein